MSDSTVFTFRCSRKELADITQAAQTAGLSVSQYLRKSAALRTLNSVLLKPQISFTISTQHAQLGTFLWTWSENPCQEVYVCQ